MSVKRNVLLLLCGLVWLAAAPCIQAQEAPAKPPQASQPFITRPSGPTDDVVVVKTRVVFLDTLVRDKKTGAPVTDLSLENFQVLDDGKARKLTYFNREGSDRRPLALMLVLDLSTSGILYLERPEVMEQIIVALSKLKPADEIAVLQKWYEPRETPLSFQLRTKLIGDFTRDRTQTVAALRSVQEFARQNLPQVKIFFSFKDLFKGAWKSGIAGAGGSVPPSGPVTTAAPDLENMIDKAPLLAQQRPNSQVVIMEVTDDFGAEGFGKTRKTAHELIGSGVTVSGMVVKRNLMDKAINLTGLVVSPFIGTRFHTISYYGKQTGGEVATVGGREEFGGAIDRIISGLAARYSLGFTLDGSERNDDRVHTLEVKIKSRGINRKLAVSARRSYIPKADQ